MTCQVDIIELECGGDLFRSSCRHRDPSETSAPHVGWCRDHRSDGSAGIEPSVTQGVGSPLRHKRGRGRRRPRRIDQPADAGPAGPCGRRWFAGLARNSAHPQAPALVLRLLVGLYKAVRDLGSAGAVRIARAALVEQQRDVDDLMIRVGTLAERAVKHAAASQVGCPRSAPVMASDKVRVAISDATEALQAVHADVEAPSVARSFPSCKRPNAVH